MDISLSSDLYREASFLSSNKNIEMVIWSHKNPSIYCFVCSSYYKPSMLVDVQQNNYKDLTKSNLNSC